MMALTRAELRSWLHSTNTSTTARLVFLALAMYAGTEDRAWPALETLAAATGYSRRTVQYSLRELEEAGDVMAYPRTGLSTADRVIHIPGSSRTEPRQRTTHTPAAHDVNPGNGLHPKVLRRTNEGAASFAPPRNGEARGPQPPSPVVTRDDGATFLPGTGWIHEPTTRSNHE